MARKLHMVIGEVIMDPKQCLIDLLYALATNERQDAIDAATGLADWLNRDGYIPEVSIEGESHGPDGSEYVLKVAL